MEVRYNKKCLTHLEEILSKNGFAVRYEKGLFKSGFCLLQEEKIVIINKFYSLEGKINCLIDILQSCNVHVDNLPINLQKLFFKISNQQLNP